MNLRPELAELPPRMRHLRVDDRGYPVPWFVPWIDGKPEFRAADDRKRAQAIRDNRCWVCGGALYQQERVFVIGPMCGCNRCTSEPPMHLECARWSALNCPFLTQREVKRREDELTRSCPMPGVGLKRNPGVACIYGSETFTPFRDQGDSWLIRLGEPTRLEFYSHGRQATAEEVLRSIDSGLPLLLEHCHGDEEREEFLASVTAFKNRVADEFAKHPPFV